MVTARPVDHPTSGPNWLLIGGTLAAVVLVAVVAFLVLASGSGNSNASGNVVTAPTEVVATPTVAATEVPPTPTPVPPTPSPTPLPLPVPSFGELKTATTAYLNSSVSLNSQDKTNLGNLLASAERDLGRGPQFARGPMNQIAGIAQGLKGSICQNPTDQAGAEVFFNLKGWVLDYIDRMYASGVINDGTAEGTKTSFKQLQFVIPPGCQNPNMTVGR